MSSSVGAIEAEQKKKAASEDHDEPFILGPFKLTTW